MRDLIARTTAALLALLICAAAAAQTVPMAAIVIDDLGNLRAEGLRAVELPGPVTYAMLPHTPHAASLARLAHALDKEVLVHLPMEAESNGALGPGALTAALDRHQFQRRVTAALASVPHASGVSNHMGSRLTAMHRPMQWLMSTLATHRSWLFLDSRTTPATVAEATARTAGLRTTSRDVFLDNEVSIDRIRRQFQELLRKAREQGSAVAIGHPYPETLQVLSEALPRLPEAGVRLVPLSALARHRAAPAAGIQVAHSSGSGHAETTR